MDDDRKANGRFAYGNPGGPGRRRAKRRTAVDEVTRELEEKVTITENGKRKRVSKLAANAKQIANRGASGDIKAAKMTIDYALKAEKEREPPVEAPALTESDKAIVERFLERLALSVRRKETPDATPLP